MRHDTPNLDRYLDPEQHDRITRRQAPRWVWCRACGIGDAACNQTQCRACGADRLQHIGPGPLMGRVPKGG